MSDRPNYYESDGRDNPLLFPEYSKFGGERHNKMLDAMRAKKVEERPYKDGILAGLERGLATPEYDFRRQFHNDRVDDIVYELGRRDSWQKYLEGREIFPEGYNRDLFRDSSPSGLGMKPSYQDKQFRAGTKTELPGLLETFVGSLFK